MNIENPTASTASTCSGGTSSAAGDRAANHPRRPDDPLDLWRVTHRALRGRYRLALVLGVIGMITGAGIGAAMGKRLYRAAGLVRIASARPAVMKETDQNQMMPMFDGYIQAQQEVMTSRETVQAAMRDEQWGTLREGRRPISDEQFAASLKVETRSRSDHLRVTFTDPDPLVAAAAVRSVIGAYQRAYDAKQNRVERQRIDELEGRRAAVREELKAVEAEMGARGAPLDGIGAMAWIDPLYEAATGRLRKLRAALLDVQCAVAGGAETAVHTPSYAREPDESIAIGLLAARVADQVRNEMELSRMTRSGYGLAHPRVVQMMNDVREGQERVARSAQSVEKWRLARAQEEPLREGLQEQEATLLRLAAAAEEDVRQLATRRARVATLGQRAIELRQRLSEVSARLDALTTEAALGSRLTIVSRGDTPMTALLDNRFKAAAVGAVLGGGAPIGMLVLLTAARGRYRNPIEVAEDLAARVPFVAVLPDAKHGASCAAAAAQAIHQLRVRLQPPTASAARTYLIASPAVGDGKSSVALSLGLSFAAAGYRTLLIDGDLAGRWLTCSFGADEAAGARDAADGGELAISAVRAGLSFMSAGRGSPQDVHTFAPEPVATLLQRVRERFDIILIDSDPLLAGVTAAVVAPQVDGVVLTVTRGQSHGSVRDAMRLLEQQGAQVAGCVFNRAAATNLRGRGVKGSRRQPEVAPGFRPPVGAVASGEAPMSRRFGPLVAAVMSSLGLSRDEDLDLMPSAAALARPTPVLQSRVA